MKNIFLNDGLYNTTKIDNYEVFEFKNEAGHIKHIFTKRAIDKMIDGEVFYDLVPTPGFGGPVVINCIPERKWDLVFEFTEAFQKYCLENNIVCEEVEFSSPFANAVDFLDCYELEYVRDRYGMDLEKPLDQIGKEDLSKLWNAIDSGVEYRVIEGEAAINVFKSFVHRSDEETYKSLNQYLAFVKVDSFDDYVAVELSFNNKVIAMNFSQVQESIVYTLFDAKASRLQYFETDKLLKCALYIWAKEKGLQKIWSPKEQLHSRMAIETLLAPICTGRKIWNEEVYQELCAAGRVDKRVQFFPAYRFTKQS
ncbi:hypothetical protein BBI15_07500 [Planococcus plakortidis]|uniref:Uncharacterized protein n=1 Tax=Planococcus plakortidis TaxID=1038856 RepID=A0A1C7E8L4_9BACL|nr:hypothetical protein [Planococcus plakortidis]ANU20069.1 hypothetical protein BBI15_07500 [Planococcus plakortidis]